ncbi:MAG: hypothetical protein QNJ30_09910 [Kiloniellales bacterium]|nr:hypothetical protein [Kiloniellales bacterium]
MPPFSESVLCRLRLAVIAGLLVGGLTSTAAYPQEGFWPHACDLLVEAGADSRLGGSTEVTARLEFEREGAQVTTCSLANGTKVATLMVLRNLGGPAEGGPADLLKAHAASVNAALSGAQRLAFEPLPALGAGAAWSPGLNQITLFKEDGSLLTLGLSGPAARKTAVELLKNVLERLNLADLGRKSG